MQGDCLERMREIPDGSVDMVLTSPPYNMNLRISGGKYISRMRNISRLHRIGLMQVEN